jgi:hypothetical protein
MTARARTFSQAPQAVRSARGRGGHRTFPSAAGAGRTLHADKCNALGLTLDIHGPGNVSGTAAARAVFRIHSSPSVANEFFTSSGSQYHKVNPVTKHEHVRGVCSLPGYGDLSLIDGRSPERIRGANMKRSRHVKLSQMNRRRGGRVAECGGLLNHLGLLRFSHFNRLQSGSDHLSRASVLSFGCKCSPLCSPAHLPGDSEVIVLRCLLQIRVRVH